MRRVIFISFSLNLFYFFGRFITRWRFDSELDRLAENTSACLHRGMDRRAWSITSIRCLVNQLKLLESL